MTNLIKKFFFGKTRSQAFFKRLFSISLEGMNIGTGGGELKNTGETYVIRYALRNTEKPVVFDVGAQGGDYFSEVLRVTDNKAQVHAFEPRSKDYALLAERYSASVTVVRSALGEKNGEATLYFPDNVSGLSSLHGGDERFTLSEKVTIETIDSYCQRKDINHIDLLKLDVEGHELACLKGAERMLSHIDYIQFEIGVASRDSRTYFKDIFELLSEFTVSRILKDGFEVIKSTDKMSELLYTTNYFAERK